MLNAGVFLTREQPELLHGFAQHTGDVPELWRRFLQLLQCVVCVISSTSLFDHLACFLAVENNCPNAYAYAYDDRTALRACNSALQADYTLTFCP